MHPVDKVCSEAGFPMCEHLSDEVCKSTSRGFLLFKNKISSPTTVILLVMVVLSAVRMIRHVKALCSSVGRKEMLMFFYLYMGSAALEAVLVGFKDFVSKRTHLFLTTIQITVYTSAFFSLFAGSITVDMFTGILGFRAVTLLKISAAIYSMVMGTVIFTGLSTSRKELVSAPFFALNLLFFFLYMVFQVRRLRKTDGEIWAYGTLTISAACFLTANTVSFVGSRPIGLLTDRYFDNLFFYHFFVLCAFIMIHKYWLSVYNYEVESLRLEV
ncbi:similarity to glucose/Na cotransporter [Encephalitozoon cuniculi GB-M1]|uniref:Similarity to glucose/Na cotransporter n=2 Tax=Encephalitozoon cuniculi TaxID=6035 RepID=Q8SW68_ENCCU|nr:uncharacterized protein ECU03_0250 [Encephalitozoon cuniculi GB-M1]AGE96565.1 glucose/na cotransporter [Encephalitozoon cuniculi]KMV66388.1 hypothetical protein M970_030160 [Encephalitozoon cuniculi EcunIII-L]UYI28014.1 chitin synthase export chaperone protein [Encephalitozoon cuniculi]CAD26171.1 similarity to glucose/Na cotransporter [Encephalitozoon cuniculi GB-M1]